MLRARGDVLSAFPAEAYQRQVIPLRLGEQVNNYINQKLGNQFSGNVFISHQGKVLFSRSYGNNNQGAPNTIDQQFGLASMGKIFTAISILQLKEKGRLELTDTVG